MNEGGPATVVVSVRKERADVRALTGSFLHILRLRGPGKGEEDNHLLRVAAVRFGPSTIRMAKLDRYATGAIGDIPMRSTSQRAV